MIHRTFPTLILQESLTPPSLLKTTSTKIRRELEGESYKFAEIDQAGAAWCEEHHYPGYTSYGSLSQIYNYSSTFLDLEISLRPLVKKFINQLEYEVTISDLEINSMWINIMPQGGFHTSHIHPLSIISGTYYVKLKKPSHSIKFEDPRLTHFMNQPLRKKQARQRSPYHVEISPDVNDVVLFESWLRHEVPMNLTTEDRISISFNYGWKNQGSSNHGSRNTTSKDY